MCVCGEKKRWSHAANGRPDGREASSFTGCGEPVLSVESKVPRGGREPVPKSEDERPDRGSGREAMLAPGDDWPARGREAVLSPEADWAARGRRGREAVLPAKDNGSATGPGCREAALSPEDDCPPGGLGCKEAELPPEDD